MQSELQAIQDREFKKVLAIENKLNGLTQSKKQLTEAQKKLTAELKASTQESNQKAVKIGSLEKQLGETQDLLTKSNKNFKALEESSQAEKRQFQKDKDQLAVLQA